VSTEPQDENPFADLDPSTPRCGAPTAKGGICQSPVAAPGARCWPHNESISPGGKRAARSRGGHATNRVRQGKSAPYTPPAPAANLVELGERIRLATTPPELSAILVEVAGLVTIGTLTAKVGATIGGLVKGALEAQRATFHERLAQIEKHLDENPHLKPPQSRTARRR
jgi:hypothetical protein